MYNDPHRTATYNAKWFVTYDAVMRNPFRTNKWMYADAGFLGAEGPTDDKGEEWGMFKNGYLDTDKFDRSIKHSGDTGVVIGEYKHDRERDINDDCWTKPRHVWKCRHFIAKAWFGNSIGMLEFSARYMQTIEDMDANGWYIGREEFVLSHVAIRYPNFLFSVPYTSEPMELYYPFYDPSKAYWSYYGGKSMVAALNDPLSTLFCPNNYKPRQPNLPWGPKGE
ncbi:Uu.00g118540.m01.CDS01 [Anthostomella pinea]|uniref:Uu.00g118540.m01.CDS01 n=1 Tax=Anthostomella pinea TaxID=933095 RepID=A0AAI8VGG4_9PEZI|nr:Uu.00g118540.m01.CDS01 [Anthostomella pinea]